VLTDDYWPEKEARADVRSMQDRFHRSELEVERQFGFAARTLIATAAGALTLSVGAFIREAPPDFTAEALRSLRFAWVMLFAAVGFGVLSLIIRYVASRRSHLEWERQAKRQKLPVGISAKKLRSISVTALLLSFAGFVVGLVALARVALALLGPSC
jgi:hypothetical protein